LPARKAPLAQLAECAVFPLFIDIRVCVCVCVRLPGSIQVGLIIWKVESDINNDETKLCFKTIGRQCPWPDLIPRKLTDPRFPVGVTVCSILLQGDGANNEVAGDVAKSTKLSRVVSRVAVGLRFIRSVS
jgi:hypothetical protein